MAATFPISPVNGELAIVNNITYVYASATRSWTRVASNVAVGGSNTQIQYNNANAFGGSPAFTFNSSTNVIAATGNITSGNLLTGGLISATGNITGGNLVTAGLISATGNVAGNYFIGNGSLLTGISGGGGSSIVNGTSNVSIPVSSGNITMSVGGQSNTVVVNTGSLTMYGTFAGPRTLSANVTVAPAVNALLLGPVTIGNGYNITVPSDSSLSTYTDGSPNIVGATVSVTGNITSGNLITSGLISAAGNITVNNIFTNGNISPTTNAIANIGSSSFQYNTVFAKATAAQYADLAENYEADATYKPGTVLCFDGAKEVTVCNHEDCTRVAGVVSTNPSYLMNSGQTGAHVASLALQGRVPTSVTGTVRKGDLMVSAGNGQAKTNNNARAGTIIGKALANSEGNAVIEVVVGRD